MNKLIIFTLILFTLASCKDASKDLAQAPSNQQIGRYGLDQIKLGEPQALVLKNLDPNIKKQLSCTHKKVALAKIRRVFISKKCTLPKNHQAIRFWDQQLNDFSMNFLDGKLIGLNIKLETSESDEVLYKKHAKHVLSLFGKPSVIDLSYIRWNKKNDQVMLKKSKTGSVVTLIIQNKKAQDYLNKKEVKAHQAAY